LIEHERCMADMDDYLFEANVSRCKHVTELTTYLEIFSYSVSFLTRPQLHKLMGVGRLV
jgi:hypothetical protein